MKYFKKNIFFIGALFIFSIGYTGFGFSQSSFATTSSAFDSLAGYGTEINITNEWSQKTKKVIVKNPKNEVFQYFFTADSDGKGKVILPPEGSTVAGIYTYTIVAKDGYYSDGTTQSFQIFPDDISSQTSLFFTPDETIKTGVKGKVTVILLDRYKNPIPHHRVNIFSNRPEDRITEIYNERTNTSGEVSFWIQSNKAGESILTIHDETSNTTLSKNVAVNFYTFFGDQNTLSADSTTTLGTTVLPAESFPEFKNVSRFEIDFPDTVTADSDANYLTLKVLDSDGNIIQDFTGSVKIQIPTDKNATVPGEEGIYTFLEKDQGEITFSRSIIFPEAGLHKLEIYAYDKEIDEINYNIFGEQSVTVEEKKTNGGGTLKDKAPTITSPENGAKFSASQISVSGTAFKNSVVKITLNEIPVIEVNVDGQGKFQAVLKNIPSGKHKINVYQKEDPLSISETIQFSVDKEVSSTQNIVIAPTEVLPGESFDISVLTEDQDDISNIQASVKSSSYTLEHVGKNTYQKTISAPQTPGEYPITITITDALQNSKTIESETITVKNNIEPESRKSITGQYNSKSKSVELSWETGDNEPLLYIIHSGINKNNLNKIKSVSGKNNSTSITDLTEGEYFFALSVVNMNGQEGEISKPITVSVINPTPTPTPTATPTPTPTFTPTPTPQTPTPTPDPQVFLQAQSESILISWEVTPNASSYQISYGIESTSYNATKKVPNGTQFIIKDLIPGVPYFIQVDALNNQGKSIYSYPEQAASPLQSHFHSAPIQKPQPYPTWITQTGPKFFYFLAALFFFCSAWYLTRSDLQK